MKKSRYFGSIARCFLFFAAFLICISAAGCNRRTEDGILGVLSGGFDAEVTVESGSFSCRATVRSYEEADGTRVGEIAFLAPDSVKGITATVRGTEYTLCRDGLSVSLTEEGAERVLLPLRLLSGGEVISHETGTEEGCDVLRCTLSDGRILTVGARDGTLRSVRYGDLLVRISWLEPRRAGDA